MSYRNVPFHEQYEIDANHLKWLAISHFAVAGFAVLGLLGMVAHYLIMQKLFSDPNFLKGPQGVQLPDVFFSIMQVFYVVAAIVTVVGGAANFFSGLFIQQRKYRVFSLVVAGFNCIHIPIGTALGVFTFIVLSRDSVRELYEVRVVE